MDSLKDSMTPIYTSQCLILRNGSPATNATNYQSLVSRMQYLPLIQRDIAYTINKLSQFLHALHWTTAKAYNST